MTDRVYNVLFLCTGNTARSILAKAFCARMARALQVLFGGESGQRRHHPFAIKTLAAYGYPTEGFRSKNWDDSRRPTRRKWISCSRFATTRRAKPARSGRVNR